MKVLLSIKPEFAEKILDGKKLFEFRRALPKQAGVKTVVIYATKPIGKVVGEFEIDSIISKCPRDLWGVTREFAGISRSFFDEYFRNRKTGHALKVKKVRRYVEPLPLKAVLSSGVAPQSFCYLF